MTSSDDLDPIARDDLDAIRSGFARLGELVPEDPRWSPGRVRSEEELAQIEGRLDFPLPPALRAYLREVGDGGAGFPLGGLPPVETLESADARFHALAEGARPTDGTMSFGSTTDHARYLLVLRGKHAGTVWIDSTGHDLGGVAPAEPPSFLAFQRAWIETEVKRVARRQIITDAARGGQLESLLEGARSEDERKDIVTELVKEGFALLEGLASDERQDHETRRTAIALVALGKDEVRMGKALLMARSFAELEAFARSVLADATAIQVARDRATVHLVVALAALGRASEIASVAIRPELAYMSPYKDVLYRAVERLASAPRSHVFRALPPRVAVDLLLAQDDIDATLAVGVADRLLRVAIADAAMENHAYNAANKLVSALDDELADIAADLAKPLAGLLTYVDAGVRRFETLAASGDGELDDAEDARNKGAAWLLAHEAELTGGEPTARAKGRFEELRSATSSRTDRV